MILNPLLSSFLSESYDRSLSTRDVTILDLPHSEYTRSWWQLRDLLNEDHYLLICLFILKYSQFTTLCLFLLHSEVIQLYIYIYIYIYICMYIFIYIFCLNYGLITWYWWIYFHVLHSRMLFICPTYDGLHLLTQTLNPYPAPNPLATISVLCEPVSVSSLRSFLSYFRFHT